MRGIFVFFALIGAASAETAYEKATKYYNRTAYEECREVLEREPTKSVREFILMGKCWFMTGEFKRASELFEKAVSLDSTDSNAFLWLGRAYGRRAETSSVFTAPGYASKARQAFERSVQLNPSNKEAANDLFEYYLQAPGFLGGGFDKAEALAARISKVDLAEGEWAHSRLAEKRKSWGEAEEALRRAAELAPTQAGRLVDVARFLAQRGRVQESEQWLARAEKVAPNQPRLLYDRAEVYVKSSRNLDEARELLKKYMRAPLTPDDPSREDAAKLLKEVGG